MITKIKNCRVCKSDKLFEFLSLGRMPIPNGFLTADELDKKEPYYPLKVCVCETCWLVQLSYIVSSREMFKNYLYIPSTSSTMLEHFKTFAKELIKKYSLSSKDLVIDIGSNDGALLGFFKEHEIKVLGVDPASNLVQVARLKGIETMDDFFTPVLAEKIRKEKGKAKIITATNVVAHIDNLHSLCQAINTVLHDDGLFVMEFPYLLDLLDKNEFDTIYHEHLSYFSFKPLNVLFEKHNLKIINIKRIPVHGGSVRIYVAKKSSLLNQEKTVLEFINQEKLRKLDKKSTYEDFTRRVSSIKRELKNYLKQLKIQGKKITGYGASAKGNVLLNYCKIGPELINFIVDSIPYKQGRFTPGTHIPIYPENRLEKEMPDYCLLMAWNFADEILRKQIKYREKGGQFIITIPYLRVE